MNHHARSFACALWIAVLAASPVLCADGAAVPAPNAPSSPSASPAEPTLIEMPRLLNLPLEKAMADLKAAGHLGTVTVSPNPPPAGAVVRMQDAVGGTEMDARRPLILVVGAPSGPSTMPRLVGQPRARAEMLLHNTGFWRDVKWKTAPAPTRGQGGLVIEQKPDANAPLKAGVEIEVTVGTARK